MMWDDWTWVQSSWSAGAPSREGWWPSWNPQVRIWGLTNISDRAVVHFCCRHLHQRGADEAAEPEEASAGPVLMEDFIPPRSSWRDSTAGNISGVPGGFWRALITSKCRCVRSWQQETLLNLPCGNKNRSGPWQLPLGRSWGKNSGCCLF